MYISVQSGEQGSGGEKGACHTVLLAGTTRLKICKILSSVGSLQKPTRRREGTCRSGTASTLKRRRGACLFLSSYEIARACPEIGSAFA